MGRALLRDQTQTVLTEEKHAYRVLFFRDHGLDGGGAAELAEDA